METIYIAINNSKLEYDVHALVRSFFPEYEVSFKEEGEIALRMEIHVGDTQADFIFGAQSYTLEGGDLDKNAFKLSFYRALCDVTGKTLPWGNLTGIRPTKIAMEGITKGRTDEEIKAFLEGEHDVSKEKQELCLQIAHREKAILDSFDYEKGYSLYIGIPFCPTTCLYCSFTSFPIAAYRKKVPAYIAALKKELIETAALMKGRHLETVYMGGGTPTSLNAEELSEILTCLSEHFDLKGVREFTVEAGRPDSITRDKLETLYRGGVNRISVNPQTMNDETLRLIGRNHTVEMLKDSFNLAREIGFDNINMDIILGLPGETKEMVQHTLSEIVKMHPDSLTVHSLAIKRASRLNQMMKQKEISCLKNTDELMELAMQAARSMSMSPYYLYRQKNMSGNFENVGYAGDDKVGLYNILIMEEVQSIVACGAGTVTKRVWTLGDGGSGLVGRIERCDDVKDVELYIAEIDEMIERKRKLFES